MANPPELNLDGTRLSALPTPALILDRDKLDRNVKRMADQLGAHGVTLRPHVKTAKAPDVIRRVLGGAGPITVSTLREASEFLDAGFDDMTYAVCIAPDKLDMVAALMARGAKLSIILDSLEAADMVVAGADRLGVTFAVLIEIDSDGHRSGLDPADPQLVPIARRLHEASGVDLRGVLTHAGGSYDRRSLAGMIEHAEQERVAITTAAGHLAAAGIPCPVVSMGSTPTALFAQSLAGVTEVRAGVYMVGDLVMAGLGVCTPDEIAVSVLATVIGHQATKGWVIVDAGWMAMSRDRGTERQAIDQGYGLVCDLAGHLLADVKIVGANQEHGIIGTRDGSLLDPKDFPIGSKLRILPNHACATGAQHGEYLVVDGAVGDADPQVVARWPRFSGW